MGLIAIDPGVHSMAVAVFESGGLLLEAWNEESKSVFLTNVKLSVAEQVERWGSPSLRLINRLQRAGMNSPIYSERQVSYAGVKGMKIDPNDLIDLSMCTGAFTGALCVEMSSTLTLVEPAEWKAQVPKDVTRRRIEALLTPSEKEGIKKGGEMHNVYDAIGIGLFALGRAKKGMVAP